MGRRFSRRKSSIKIKTPADDFLNDAKSTTADPPADPPAEPPANGNGQEGVEEGYGVQDDRVNGTCV